MPRTDSPELTQRRLLQSIVEMARGVFGSAAASVFLVDQESGDLVFEAVAGEGEDWLPGTSIPADTGIAGWIVNFGQSLIVDDVSVSPLFGRAAAESTGYVPKSIMAAPLFHDGDCIGVIEVLDRDTRPRRDQGDLESLGLLATETSAVLALLVRLRSLESEHGDRADAATDGMALLRRVTDRLPTASEPVRATATKLLTMADELLAEDALGVGTRGG